MSRDTVLLLAALAVCLGGVVGSARNLPRALGHSAAWRRDTEVQAASSSFTLTVLIVLRQASIAYPAWRTVVRRHGRSG